MTFRIESIKLEKYIKIFRLSTLRIVKKKKKSNENIKRKPAIKKMYWVIKIANILRYVIHSKTNILIKLYNSFSSKLFSVGEMSWSQSRIYVRWVILLWPFLRNISKNILNASRL